MEKSWPTPNLQHSRAGKYWHWSRLVLRIFLNRKTSFVSFWRKISSYVLVVSFYFWVRIESGKKMRHFDLMPKVVGEFVDDHGLHEVRVALTRGVWRSAGDQTVPVQSAPAGALVHAVFQDRPHEGEPCHMFRRLHSAWSDLHFFVARSINVVFL